MYYSNLEERLREMVECDAKDPDVVVYGPTWLNKPRSFTLKPGIPRICFVHKIGLQWRRKENFLRHCDVVLSSVPKLPIKHTLFKYAVDPVIFNRGGEKVFDFGFSGALHEAKLYPPGTFSNENLRPCIQGLARQQSDLSCFLNGSDSIKPRIKTYEAYADTIAKSKTWLATTGPNGDIGPRYYEVMASGTLLLCDEPPEEYKDTFRDKDNCVYITKDNFVEKLRYYLEHEDEMERIIDTAYRDCMENHTWETRARELLDICAKEIERAAI